MFSTLCVLLNPFQNTNAQTWKELMDSSKAYQVNKESQIAFKIAEQALAMAERQFDKTDSNYADNIFLIADLYDDLDNDEKAIEIGIKSLELYKNYFKSDNVKIADNCLRLGYWNRKIRNFDKAEFFYLESEKIRKRLVNVDDNALADNLNEIAFFYEDLGKTDKTEHYLKEVLEIRRKNSKSDNIFLTYAIGNLAYFLVEMGKYSEAEPLFKENIEMSQRLFKGDNPDLATSMNNYALFLQNLGRFDEAGPIHKEVLEMRRRLFIGDHPDLAISLDNMSSFYNTIGSYNEALPLLKESLQMRRNLYKGDNPDLNKGIGKMANLLTITGHCSEAEPLFIENLEMGRRLFKGDHPSLVGIIGSIAAFYDNRGKFKEAEKLYKEALDMAGRLFQSDNPLVAGSMNNMARFLEAKGRFKEAEPLFKESLNMQRRIYKKDNPMIAISLNNMGFFYDRRGNYVEAEPLYLESIEMRRRLYKSDHPQTATTLSNLAELYCNMKMDEKAEKYYMETLEMNRHIFKVDHPDLIRTLNNLAMFYFEKGRIAEAEPLYNEVLEMSRRIYKGNHPDLAYFIKNRASFLSGSNRSEEAEPLFKETLDIYKNIINTYFPSLSDKEKRLFWNTVSSNFESFNSYACNRAKYNPAILCNMYDNCLFTKSMLLNSSNRIKQRIVNSGDSNLIEQFREWSDLREYLVTLYKMSDLELKKKRINLDSIEKNANELERSLSINSEIFKQSFEKKNISWKQIQTLLKPDEAAVEVVRYKYFDSKSFKDSIIYAFLIVSDQTEEHPEIMVFENGKELENEFYNDYRSLIEKKVDDKKSFERYWSKLNERLVGFKKIYFSTDGIYNKLNQSTFILPDGRYILDIQDIQQVNSTKDLLLGYYQTKQESNIYNSAMLVGNPNFKLSEDEVKVASRKIKGKKADENSFEQLVSTRGVNLTKLPGTEKEIKDIEKFLIEKKWEVSSYLGDNALKTAIKTANNPRVLHIATHGLFLEDVNRESKEIFGFNEKKLIENPLLRSGLFFTGADNFLKKENSILGDEEDNGLLTAYEAMNLDLDKTELVVLSACETGLGEIQNGEGVFGLRRAFQQAGAKSVIMSLWKVDDSATQELMSSFYKNWVTGMPKRDAFSHAQQEVKSKYKKPYYWGAFVMVGE